MMINNVEKNICYSKEDNRHFVHSLRTTRETGLQKNKESQDQSDDYRDVHVSFRVHNVHEIDQKNQRFHVLFNVYTAWDENLNNITIEEEHANINTWQKEMFYPEKSEWKVFDPQIRFTNCMDFNKTAHEEWFRVVKYTLNVNNDDWKEYEYLSVKEVYELQQKETKIEGIRIIRARKVQGWFEEDFEMLHFPLDVQHLHIGVTSRWDHSKVGIYFDKFIPSTVSSEALNAQTWEMGVPRMLSFRDDWGIGTLPMLTRKLDSATGKQYCKAYFALTVTRCSGFVMWNVLFILALIGLFSFASFALDPSEIGSRQTVVLTLVLTTVAFKYVAMEMMPEIPYLTMLDVVLYTSLLLQGLMLLFISIVANIKDQELQIRLDWIFFLLLAIGWLCLGCWFLIKYFIINHAREKYLKACDDYYRTSYRSYIRDKNKDRASILEHRAEVPKGNIPDFSPSFKRGVLRKRLNTATFQGNEPDHFPSVNARKSDTWSNDQEDVC